MEEYGVNDCTRGNIVLDHKSKTAPAAADDNDDDDARRRSMIDDILSMIFAYVCIY